MAGPLYAYVPIDALRAFVEYADGERRGNDDGLGLNDVGRRYSDEEFRAKVAALGVPALLPDEVGAG